MQDTEYKAVVFDMDGLMVDTEPIYKIAMQKAVTELGYTLDDEFYSRLVGRPDATCMRMIHQYFGENFPIDKLWKRWPQIWKDHAESYGIPQKPGLSELLSFLREHEIPTAIATSSNNTQAEFSLWAAAVDHPFDFIVTGDKVANGKPAPDIYLKAAEGLNINPEHCIALEDSDNGILSAHHAGMTTFLVPDMQQPSNEILSLVDEVSDSLMEVREKLEKLIGTPG